MNTRAHQLRKQLEARGDQTKLANLDTGWFAIVPRKWQALTRRAQSEGREGPNLILYRTKTKDPRDHYVIPYTIASLLLTDETAPVRKDGSRRWELTISPAGRLHVSHGSKDIDVSPYHRAPLPGEIEVQADSDDDRDDDGDFFARHEGREVWITHRKRERNSELVQSAKHRALSETSGLSCRVCGFDFADVYGELGQGFAEVHHAIPLSNYKADGQVTRLADLVIVCSNCHRMLHRRRPWLTTDNLALLIHR